MYWKEPPLIKAYEALGTVADRRIALDGDSWSVHSSSGNKVYIVRYDPRQNVIESNDNGSYWQGYLGYPALAVLIELGKVQANAPAVRALKGIAWKDLNVANKNDYQATLAHVEGLAEKHGVSKVDLRRVAEQVIREAMALGLEKPARRTKPPKGY